MHAKPRRNLLVLTLDFAGFGHNALAEQLNILLIVAANLGYGNVGSRGEITSTG